MSTDSFVWRDGERTIRFGEGAADALGEHLSGPYELLVGGRAATVLQGVPEEVRVGSEAVHGIPEGSVDDLAAGLLDSIREGITLVAIGGGRVIDTAKAVGAARGCTVVAVPTTYSGAELTSVHRVILGAAPARRIRPQTVITDPRFAATLSPANAAASIANALAHAIEAGVTAGASPVPVLAASSAVQRIAAAVGGSLDLADPTVRGDAALGALLAGYALDSAGLGPCHVIAQSIARSTRGWHAGIYAAVLPQVIPALRARRPELLEGLDQMAGRPVQVLASEIAVHAGVAGLRSLGITTSELDHAMSLMRRRPEFAAVPPAPDADELADIVAAAW